MRLTIIPSDSFVSVNGDATRYSLNISGCDIPEDVHALQWFETKGWIEFEDSVTAFGFKKPNEEITTLPQWALEAVQVWENWEDPATVSNSPAPSIPTTVI